MDKLENIWAQALEAIRSQLNEQTYKTWFSKTKPVSISSDSFVVSAANDFAKDWLEARYASLITSALLEATGKELAVSFITRPSPSAPPIIVREGTSDSPPPVRQSNLNAKYSFDSFVIGSSNRFAHAAALAVAEKPSRSYNPLFIYGGVGLGKTHLLQAIGRYVLEQHRSLEVKYVSSEKFTNDFINSIRDKEKIVGFQGKYRDNDVLLVDDIQFLENKEATQEEFFHTFNTLYEANKQIIISSDRPPKQIATLEERLRTRFESGLIVDIQPPDIETRIAILKKRAQADGLVVSDDVLEFIATKVQSNIRELEGALIRTVAFSSLTSSDTTLELARNVLKDVFPDGANQAISISNIQSEVCKFYQLTRADLVGSRRSRPIVLPRQVAMYLARELTDASLPKIGSAFGKRDHSTVLHATTKIEKLLNEKIELYNQIQELTTRIKSRY